MKKRRPMDGICGLVLDDLAGKGAAGVRFVPAEPSPAMVAAGVRAAGITEAAARKAYRAMVSADGLDEAPLTAAH